ncbi:MAG TPA: aspartate-semialdehyde dehydrogenase [Candidatus Atribacteria bacterium]|nr:aspartate-semialdehyde dehydrogenase [Candidatus Atribacteria bacterium]
MSKLKVAIAGVTGAVGQEMLKILEERAFPVSELIPLASERSRGKEITFHGEKLRVQVLSEFDFKGVDLALFSAGAKTSKAFAPLAASKGCIVIDNSSAFRQDPEVPLIVPEVNSHKISEYKNKNIIANPNCTTIISIVPLKPLHDFGKIKRVVAASYQATSGAGALAMQELREQIQNYVEGKPMEVNVFPHQIAFNLIPHIDVFMDNFYTKEEMKMVWETQKIMDDDSIKVTATCVRVPVFRAHSVALTIETERKITREKAIELLTQAPGVVVEDDPARNKYPMPWFVAGKDECFVGRIREDTSHSSALTFWVVGDQLRKGAALNAIQIAELLIQENIL